MTDMLLIPDEIPVRWKEVLAANSRFVGDTALVKGQKKLVSPFIKKNAPNKGIYWVTDWSKVIEEVFLSVVRGREVVILVGCMDKDFARPLWTEASKIDPNALIIPLFVAGGAAQIDDAERLAALATIIRYICQNANVVKIVLTGHTCGCGGLKHFNEWDVPVYEALGDHSDGSKERRFVKERVNQSQPFLIPPSHQGVVERILVFNRDHMRWHRF